MLFSGAKNAASTAAHAKRRLSRQAFHSQGKFRHCDATPAVRDLNIALACLIASAAETELSVRAVISLSTENLSIENSIGRLEEVHRHLLYTDPVAVEPPAA